MLLATLPARYARIMGTDWSIKNEVAPDGQAKYVPEIVEIPEERRRPAMPEIQGLELHGS